jgi:hypothetical protein
MRQEPKIAKSQRTCLTSNAAFAGRQKSEEAVATTFADSIVRQSRGTDRDHDGSNNPADAGAGSPS